MNGAYERGAGLDVAIEPLGDARVAEVGDMLGRAFAENPVARAALSHCTTGGRLSRVKRLNRAMVRATQSVGGVEIARAEGRVVGASLWFAPNQRMEGARDGGPGGVVAPHGIHGDARQAYASCAATRCSPA